MAGGFAECTTDGGGGGRTTAGGDIIAAALDTEAGGLLTDVPVGLDADDEARADRGVNLGLDSKKSTAAMKTHYKLLSFLWKQQQNNLAELLVVYTHCR